MNRLLRCVVVVSLLASTGVGCSWLESGKETQGPVAVVAWIKGEVLIRSREGHVQPARLEAELLLTDYIEAGPNSAVILGLNNGWVVKIATKLYVRDIPALGLPPTARPVEVQLSELLDATTVSAADELKNGASRLAGWHMRRNAAQTVTAQPKMDKDKEGARNEATPAPAGDDPSMAPAPQPEPADEAMESLANGDKPPGSAEVKVASPPPQKRTAQPVQPDKRLQDKAEPRAPLPPPPAMPPAPAGADRGDLKEKDNVGQLKDATPPAETPGPSAGKGGDLKQQVQEARPARTTVSKAKRPAPLSSLVQVTARPRRSDAKLITNLQTLLSDPGVQACLRRTNDGKNGRVRLGMILRNGMLDRIEFVEGKPITGCAALDKARTTLLDPARTSGQVKASVELH
ncbi:MAG: hypothetical protein ABIJ09_05830 [Pseudomonadota bacterium]